jgi:hypothetical protein
MTRVNSNFDEMLRRALHAEVDSVEPAKGGLDRIRRRTHAPWLVRQASLMLTECADLVRLIGIRLEPGFTGMRATVAARGGVWEASVAVLSSTVASATALTMPSRRRGAMHRGGRGGASGPSPERPGSNLAWLRPVLAVAGAVVIVVAGVFGLAAARDKLALELFPSNAPASTGAGTASTSGQSSTTPRQSNPGVIPPTSTRLGSPKPSPKATCSKAPNRQAIATPSDTTTPPATPSVSPTPAPSDTTDPSPTGSAATSALTVNGGTGIQTVVNIAPAATCASPAPSPAPSTAAS